MTHTYSPGDEPIPGSRYRLQTFLGRGGFGEVWKAAAPGGTEAALKIIHLGGVEGRKEFRALQLVKRIRHPNLVPIIAFWLKSADGTVLDDTLIAGSDILAVDTKSNQLRETLVAPPDLGRPHAVELIMAMGLGDMSLFDRLQKAREEGLSGIPTEELLHYMEGAAAAVDYLNRPVHELGSGPVAIQHCDIKPHNIMIVGESAQVCDFGLARAIGSVRATTTVAGTIAYAAPECLQAGKPSDSTDQYSLAVTYYELRTGRLPYQAETYAAVTAAILVGHLDFVGVSSAEQEVLRRATAMDPAERFPSATAMVHALRAACDGRRGPLPAAPAARRSAAPRVVAGVLALALLAAVGYGGYVIWPKVVTPSPEPRPAPPKTQNGKDVMGPEIVPKPKEVVTKPKEMAAKPKEVPVTVPKPDPVKEAEPHLKRGTELLIGGKYDEAIGELEKAAALTPRDVRVHSRLGSAWFRKGEPRKAIAAFTEAIQVDPDATDYVNRGRCHMDLDELDPAVADFGKAIELDPGCAPAYHFRGDCRLRTEDFAGAVGDFDLAIDLATNHPDPDFDITDAYTFRGLALMGQNRLGPAVEDLSRALKTLDVLASGDIRGARADCYDALGKKELAQADRQAAALIAEVGHKPNDPLALARLAFALITGPDAVVRDGPKAVALATQACGLSKWGDPSCLDALAAADAETGRFEDAVKWAQKAVELAPDDAARAKYQARLDLYKSGKPYRESAPAKP